MKKINLFFGFTIFATALMLASCKSEGAASTKTAEATTAAADAATAAPDANAVTNGETTPAPTGPTTTIEFESMVHDFGEVMEGTKVKHSYKLKNTGKEPLIISDAKGSCGCTVPDWPREPIPPGGTAEIKVEFDSKGKGTDDGSKQTKRVTITANTNPPQTYLTITGVVKKDPKAPKTQQ